MNSGHRPGLSALIVNYNTATLTRNCVASLRAQQLYAPDGSSIDLEIIVVDNDSWPADRDALRDLEATVIHSEDNRGYGAALNAATAQARGEFLLFSNPDTWYFPDALQQMLMACRRLPRCGAVGPRLWWDHNREFLLPPSDVVTLSAYVREVLAESWPRWGQYWTSRWLRQAVQYWQGEEAIPQLMLSGACLLTHREVVQKCGGFDERFRLYYEDSDWCRRLRQHGYRLYYAPTADVAHFYNQSARQDSVAAQARFAESAIRYFHKHYGEWAWKLATAMTTAMRTYGKLPSQDGDYLQLGKLTEPPQLIGDTREHEPYLFLLSPAASGIPAIARFSEVPSLRIPLSVWQQLGDGRFYARLVSLSSLQVLGRWSWEK
jgi:GT2 family glycosyltransferase